MVTRKPSLSLVAPNDPTVAIGFGHLGSAPAAFVVKRILKVEIIPETRDDDTQRYGVAIFKHWK